METKKFNFGDRVFLVYCGIIYEGKIIEINYRFAKNCKILCYNSANDLYFEVIQQDCYLFTSTENLIKYLIANRELFPEKEQTNEPECCYNCKFYLFERNLCKLQHLAVLPELTKCQEYEPIKKEEGNSHAN